MPAVLNSDEIVGHIEAFAFDMTDEKIFDLLIAGDFSFDHFLNNQNRYLTEKDSSLEGENAPALEGENAPALKDASDEAKEKCRKIADLVKADGKRIQEKFDSYYGEGASRMLHGWYKKLVHTYSRNSRRKAHPLSLFLSQGLHLCRNCSFGELYRQRNRKRKLEKQQREAASKRSKTPAASV